MYAYHNKELGKTGDDGRCFMRILRGKIEVKQPTTQQESFIILSANNQMVVNEGRRVCLLGVVVRSVFEYGIQFFNVLSGIALN